MWNDENWSELLNNLSLVSFAEKTKGIRRLIIGTSKEERMITKDGLIIEVIPVYKFIMGAAF